MVNDLFNSIYGCRYFSFAVRPTNDVVSSEFNGNDDGKTNDGAPHVFLAQSDVLDSDFDCWVCFIDSGNKGVETKEIVAMICLKNSLISAYFLHNCSL